MVALRPFSHRQSIVQHQRQVSVTRAASPSTQSEYSHPLTTREEGWFLTLIGFLVGRDSNPLLIRRGVLSDWMKRLRKLDLDYFQRQALKKACTNDSCSLPSVIFTIDRILDNDIAVMIRLIKIALLSSVVKLSDSWSSKDVFAVFTRLNAIDSVFFRLDLRACLWVSTHV